MHRSLILGLLFSLLAGVANAACPGNPSTCGDPMQGGTSGSVMYATAWGVQADGVTSDDVALKAAVDACAAKGGKLVLPPGRILMTGAATVSMRNCAMVGAGVPSSGDGTATSGGTQLWLTSTSVRPFNCGFYWSWSGFSVYYPNQDGQTVYQPLLSDDGGGGCGRISITDVTWINPYDGIAQVGAPNWGDIIITNSRLFAVHDLLRLSTIGDGLTLGAVRIDPGPWLSICNFADTCKAAMDRATGSNSVLHATAGGTVNIGIENAVISGFRYGVRIDAGAVVGESKIDSVFEVGTVIDASAGGNYAPENVMTGQATCAIPKYATAQGKGSPCFNMGANSSLFLHDFLASASGDFVSMAGGYLRLQNAQVESARDPASTADYYIARLSGSMSINIQNSRFAGTPSNAHAHGIVMSSTPLDIQIQNNLFLYLNEVINMATGGANIITGNMSSNTTGASAITLTGGNQVIHANNRWDKSPLATISACGTGPQSQGAFAGLFVAGPGAPTDCTITFPWVPYGFGAGACAFTLTTPAVTVAGAPISNTAWTVHFSAGYNGAVYYNCPGQN